MALKLELAPFERVILGSCDITNGPRRAQTLVGKSGPVLRGKYILNPSVDDGVCKKFYLAVQEAYLAQGSLGGSATIDAVRDAAVAAMKDHPQIKPIAAEIIRQLTNGPSFQVMKLAAEIVSIETSGMDASPQPTAMAC